MELPEGYEFKGSSIYKYREGHSCGEAPIDHLEQDCKTPDNKLLIGYGRNSNEATDNAISKCIEHYKFNQLTSKAKLTVLVNRAKQRGQYYSVEVFDVLNAMYDVIMKD